MQKTGRDGVTCFIVDRDMGWKSEYIHTMGEWGPASLIFENVRVPEENILGELHGGYKLGLRMDWICEMDCWCTCGRCSRTSIANGN